MSKPLNAYVTPGWDKKPGWQQKLETALTAYGMSFVLPPAGLAMIMHGDLAPIVDEFDSAVRESNQFMEARYRENMATVREQHGEGWIYYNSAVSYEFGMGLTKILQGAGGGLLDMLRFGEMFRDPSGGTVLRDGLRVLNVVDGGLVSRGTRALQLLRARNVPGGLNSCAVTGMTSAIVLSGKRLFAPIYHTFAEVAGRARTTVSAVLSERFGGLFPDQVLDALTRYGVKARHFGRGTGMREMAQSVLHGEGPVVVYFHQPHLPYAHYMTLFRGSSGQLKLIDQQGTWLLEWTETGIRLKNVAPSRLGRAGSTVEHTYANIIGEYAVQVENAMVLPEWYRKLPRPFHDALSGVPLAAQGAQAAVTERPSVPRTDRKTEPIDVARPSQADPLSMLAIPFFELAPEVALILEFLARKATGRPRPEAPVTATQGVVGPKGNGKGGPVLRTTAGLIPSPGLNSETGQLTTVGQYLYVCAGGETLFGLAKQFYGDAAACHAIQGLDGRPVRGFQGHHALPKGMTLKFFQSL